MDKEIYEFLVKINKIANTAVSKAQEENRQKGLPNVYCSKGKIYFELPDGTLSVINPL